LKGFGFGSRTDIELPGEVAGYLRDRSHWYGIDLATISFGQGISISAIQLAAAVSAVANGGNLMKPYIIDRISDDNGNLLQQSVPQLRRKVVSPHTAQLMAKMMEGVTDEGGTGTKASVDGYSSAGKTGTAQKVDPLTKCYSATKRTASFVGFVPVEQPKLTILVVVDEPKTSSYGGVVAAPAFSAIAQQTLCYLKVPQSRTQKAKSQVPVLPAVATKVQAPEVVDEDSFYVVNEGSVMPVFHGMSLRMVLR
jgi:cell division protein FtsI (penicillin-binding protein 3)